MVAAIGYPALVLFTESKEIGEIATPFYMFVSAVVGAYIGFSAWEDTSRNKRPDYKDWRHDPLIDPEDYRDNRRY